MSSQIMTVAEIMPFTISTSGIQANPLRLWDVVSCAFYTLDTNEIYTYVRVSPTSALTIYANVKSNGPDKNTSITGGKVTNYPMGMVLNELSMSYESTPMYGPYWVYRSNTNILTLTQMCLGRIISGALSGVNVVGFTKVFDPYSITTDESYYEVIASNGSGGTYITEISGDTQIDVGGVGIEGGSYTITPVTTNASMTINGQPFTSPVNVSGNSTIAASGKPYTVQTNITNVSGTFNGTPLSDGGNIQVGANGTLDVTANPVQFTPTIDDDIMLKFNGAEMTSGTPVTAIGTANTLLAENTKITPTVTFTFDDGVEVQLNEVTVVSGQTYPLTQNGQVVIASASTEESTLVINYTNMNTFTIDGNAVTSGQSINIAPGTHQLSATGATAIPTVSINGEGITQFSVNGSDFAPTNLPYTFTPTSGQTNSIYITGSDTASRTITISGTHIASMTVNNQLVTLPYTVTVTEPLDISVSGEIYQVDVSSKGGAIIKHNDTIISNGESLHTIIDVTKDQYIAIDGTHTLTVTGQDIKTITINGVAVDVTQLPVTIHNNNMSATVVIGGYPPSEIHVTGLYIDSAALDGNAIEVGANGSIDLEVEVRDENHFLTLAGSQPRVYNLTFQDNGTTDISVNGQEMNDGQVLPINDSKFISALPTPIPLNIDADDFAIVKVDGVPYYGDFTTEITKETYLEINSSSCILTIDYGDNSYQVTVPQRMVTLTAPHRDGWIFDTWTSNDIGIVNPRFVQCNIDLTGKTNAHLIANYQRFVTCDKPNPWN